MVDGRSGEPAGERARAHSALAGGGRDSVAEEAGHKVHGRGRGDLGQLRARRVPHRAAGPRRADAHPPLRGRVHLRARGGGRRPGRRGSPARESRRPRVQAQGVAHAFWNPADEPARALEIISPAGFERYFAELAPLFPPANQGPLDEEAVRGVRKKYGLEMDMSSIPVLAERHGLLVDAPPPSGK
jgi:hypothetical protein